MLVAVVAFTLATLASALTSAVEVALISLPELRVTALNASLRPGARALATLKAAPVTFFATVWVVRLAAAAAAALSAWNAASLVVGIELGRVLIAIAATAIALVLGNFLARALALRAAERICLVLSTPLWLLSRLLLVVIRPTELLIRSLSVRAADVLPGITDQEIRDLVNPGSAAIDEHERRLIQRAFQLDQTTAYDIMTPRVDMFAWSETRTLAEITPELRQIHYSRIPLYRGSIDKITGVLYLRDAFQALVSSQRDVQLKDLAREPFFVPGSVTLDKLLLDFQTRRIHLGIVIDEYGGVDGVITLEDILEELVGEIVDESDVAQEQIMRLGRNAILVDGSADLREINHFFNATFPLLEHRSLNGYLCDLLGHVPEPGRKIVREGVLIEIREATDTQVVRARLSRVAPRGKAGESESPAGAAEGGAAGGEKGAEPSRQSSQHRAARG